MVLNFSVDNELKLFSRNSCVRRENSVRKKPSPGKTAALGLPGILALILVLRYSIFCSNF